MVVPNPLVQNPQLTATRQIVGNNYSVEICARYFPMNGGQAGVEYHVDRITFPADLEILILANCTLCAELETVVKFNRATQAEIYVTSHGIEFKKVTTLGPSVGFARCQPEQISLIHRVFLDAGHWVL